MARLRKKKHQVSPEMTTFPNKDSPPKSPTFYGKSPTKFDQGKPENPQNPWAGEWWPTFADRCMATARLGTWAWQHNEVSSPEVTLPETNIAHENPPF